MSLEIKVPFSEMAGPIEDVLARGCRVRLRVAGDSMSPWLRDGKDEIILRSPGERSWGNGDIVLARDERGRFILHRVARRSRGSIWLRGDAQTVMEGPWPDAQVLAVVESVVRQGRELAMASIQARWFQITLRLRRALPSPLLARLRALRRALGVLR
jgi:hypothetical protein